MRRILFFCLLLCGAASAQENAVPARPEIRGVWIHTYQAWDWDEIMPKIAAAGFNCVFVRVARGVNAIYPSQFLPRDAWAEKQPDDELSKAIAAAHRSGLQFHAWKVNFNASAGPVGGDSIKAFYGKMLLDNRLVRDPDDKPATSLNPADPRNQQLEIDVMTEIATKYPVDGIHFDYIRYPDSPHFDFDYGPVSRREFEKSIGRAVVNWPRDVISGEDKIAYEDWERENINGVVQRVHGAVKKLRPECQISAAVWRKHRKNRAVIKQDWIKWVDSGWLDFVVPMDYTKDAEEFRADVRSQVANTSGKVPLAAGIGSFMQASPADVVKQIQIAREEGADGYILFDYKREGMDAILDALAAGPQKTKVITPLALLPRFWGVPIISLIVRPVAREMIRRKDEVPVVPAWQKQELQISSELASNNAGSFTVETLVGKVLQDRFVPDALPSGPQIITGWPNSRVDFTVPEGRFRVVVHSQIKDRRGVSRPIEIRGPIMEGVSEQAYKALRGSKITILGGKQDHVSLFSDGQAAKGIAPTLQGAIGERFRWMDSDCQTPYLPTWLLRGDVKTFFLPQLNDVAGLSQSNVDNLRKWVNDGGTLILTHDAVGWRWHPRLFPQIGQGSGLTKNTKIEILPNTYGLTPGSYESNFPDHVTIEPGPGGVVLAKDENGAAVVVGGKVGKGKVILCGQLLGYMPNGKLPPEEERLIQELAR